LYPGLIDDGLRRKRLFLLEFSLFRLASGGKATQVQRGTVVCPIGKRRCL